MKPEGKPEPAEGPPTDDDGRAYGDESPFSRSRKRPLLSLVPIPVSVELPGYRPHTARRDGVAAGLVLWALLRPGSPLRSGSSS